MADNEPTISMAGINAPPLYRLVEDGDKTVIMTADTNTPMWVINGKIGGDTVEVMTTAERTAITPEAGQLIFDTTLGLLFVGDGSTQGGTAVGGGGGGGVVPGYRLSDDGTALNFNPVQPIVTVTGSSVTLAPDTAYKMYATTGAVTINANPPASGYWGLESHIELFVGSTGYIVTGTNVVLANALEPDSVNNCTVRFHDGIAIISVEDHVAGYIVVSGSTSGEGSLYYGIATSTNDYVAFDASLNGSVIPLAGATAEGEKHLVGNGYTETTLTGAVDCGTSKFTVANLALSDVQVTGGTMTLGDALLPSGSTVAVSGGGLAIEKVTGAGAESVIDLGGTRTTAPVSASIQNCTLTNGEGAIFVGGLNRSFTMVGCRMVNNVASALKPSVDIQGNKDNGNVTLSSCVISGNTNNGTGGLYLLGGSAKVVDTTITDNVATISGVFGDCELQSASVCTFSGGCTLGKVGVIQSSVLTLAGSNVVDTIGYRANSPGSVTLTSGAILDLTGNTNPTPIAPGGGIIFEEGGATVLYSSGEVSGSYMMDNVTLPAGAKLTNTAVVNLGGTNVVVSSGVTVTGCTFTGGSAVNSGGAFAVTGNATFSSCTFVGNNAGTGRAISIGNGHAIIRNCFFDNTSPVQSLLVSSATALIQDSDITAIQTHTTSTTVTLAGEVELVKISGPGGQPSNGGNVVISSGAVLDFAPVTSSAVILTGGTIEVLDGGCQIKPHGGGATVNISAGIYTQFSSDGTTVPPQE